MVYLTGVKNQNINSYKTLSFGQKEKNDSSKALEEENKSHKDNVVLHKTVFDPVKNTVKIQADRLKNAFTKYPVKGFKGSKNANFYEFLTMGMVPYLIGSGMLMAVFTLASKFFDTPSSLNSLKANKKVALGVAAYGVMKTLSKKFIQIPVKLIRGVDENLAYEKTIYELPEKGNENNLISKEYHKVFESVDFPRWDLLYNDKHYGDERTSYYKKIAKKFGFKDEELEQADQKVKPKIRETLIKTKLFSTLSSYFWAATGVALAMQKPFENVIFNPITRLNQYKNYKETYTPFIKEFGSALVKSCKELVNNSSKAAKIAGRGLLGCAIGLTLLGNFISIKDFNKDKGSKTHASTSLIDESKEKVVC